MAMKVAAINGSPKMERGNTALILGPFLEGMGEAGAEVELFYTQKMLIHPCQGDHSCTNKTPGRCFQQDDMQALLPRMARADVLVLATPLYYYGVSGPLKNLLDRTVPLSLPLYELRDGHCVLTAREGYRGGKKLALVSTCGFWEPDTFDALVAHMRSLSRLYGAEFSGALLRPHIKALKWMMEQGAPVGGVFEAAREAGRQLAQEGRIAPETLEAVSRELLPQDKYVQYSNLKARAALDALEKQARA